MNVQLSAPQGGAKCLACSQPSGIGQCPVTTSITDYSDLVQSEQTCWESAARKTKKKRPKTQLEPVFLNTNELQIAGPV